MSVGPLAKVTSTIQALLNRRYANTKRGSLRNIGAHYDISNTMYEAFLSADMTYSCAIFPTLDADVQEGPLLAAAASAAAKAEESGAGGRGVAPGMAYRTAGFRSAQHDAGSNGPINVNGLLTPESSRGTHSPTMPVQDELEEAQTRKLRTHIERANLQSGHRVLEIGTGWGSLAIEAVRSSGCRVDSLTLSVEQKALAETRIAAAGLSDRIKVHLMDYRDMPASWTDRFDRVISIEMLEAVGIEFLSTYFGSIDRVLNKDGGVLVFQCITMPEERFQTYIDTVDFIKRWIFPGGVLPSVTSLIQAVERGAKRGLVLDTVHSIGPHYARTLREWRRRFEASFDTIIKPALLRDHAEIRRLKADEQDRECEVFRRKWICEYRPSSIRQLSANC
ncbi:hypothetical protein L7F22_000371 [Adiantum nelumboides]|nr:hypothetical protein [Adiantum nelumboides]